MLPLVRKIHERPTSTMTGLVMKRHLGRPTERELLGGIVKVNPKKVEDINLLPLREVKDREPKMPEVHSTGKKAPKTKPYYGMVDVRTI